MAQLDPGIDYAIFIPIIAIVMGGLIAITSMLIQHQRKMAELIRKDTQRGSDVTDEVRAMRSELAEMRDRLNQQTLMLESRPRPSEVPERQRE